MPMFTIYTVCPLSWGRASVSVHSDFSVLTTPCILRTLYLALSTYLPLCLYVPLCLYKVAYLCSLYLVYSEIFIYPLYLSIFLQTPSTCWGCGFSVSAHSSLSVSVSLTLNFICSVHATGYLHSPVYLLYTELQCTKNFWIVIIFRIRGPSSGTCGGLQQRILYVLCNL